MSRETRLVEAARYALQVLRQQTHGQQDRILSARELSEALAAYDDVEPLHEADHRAWAGRHEAVR